MAYTPTTWASGDTITAEKLNKIENGLEAASEGGGGGDVFVVKFLTDWEGGASADKTLAEIRAAEQAGKTIVGVIYEEGEYSIYRICTGLSIGYSEAIFTATTLSTDGSTVYLMIDTITRGSSVTWTQTAVEWTGSGGGGGEIDGDW